MIASLSILAPMIGARLPLPLFLSRVSAGFPSPAEDYTEGHLDLNEHLIRQPAATFFVRARGVSMTRAGIHDGDILIVDRSVEATPGRVIVATVGGEFLVKRLRKTAAGLVMVAESDTSHHYPPLPFNEESHLWGVVTAVIHRP